MILERNSSLGAPFALVENFERSQTISLVSRSKFSTNTKLPPQILEFDSNKSDSSLRENERSEFSWQSIIKINRTKCESLQKFLLLFAFAKSRVPFTLTDSNPPRESQQC